MEQDKNVATQSTPQTTGGSQTSLVIGGVLVVIIVIFGGWYWSIMDDMGDMHEGEDEMMMETTAPAPGTPEEIAASEATTIGATTALGAQGTSDELGSIEADLSATDLNSLGDPSQL